MSITQKQKLCWNCEARVTYQEEYCPYCGVYLSPDTDINDLNSFLQPPYQMGKPDQTIPSSPFSETSFEEASSEKDQSVNDTQENEDLEKGSAVLPLIFLLSGSVFFVFGIILWLFSDNGIFSLQWNANYWYFYFWLSIPLLFFGWRKFRLIND